MRKLTIAEIGKEVVVVYKRMRKIEAILKKRGIPKEEKVPFQEEEKLLFEKLAMLRDGCHHPTRDRSIGGGTFCSICDKMLEYD